MPTTPTSVVIRIAETSVRQQRAQIVADVINEHTPSMDLRDVRCEATECYREGVEWTVDHVAEKTVEALYGR